MFKADSDMPLCATRLVRGTGLDSVFALDVDKAYRKVLNANIPICGLPNKNLNDGYWHTACQASFTYGSYNAADRAYTTGNNLYAYDGNSTTYTDSVESRGNRFYAASTDSDLIYLGRTYNEMFCPTSLGSNFGLALDSALSNDKCWQWTQSWNGHPLTYFFDLTALGNIITAHIDDDGILMSLHAAAFMTVRTDYIRGNVDAYNDITFLNTRYTRDTFVCSHLTSKSDSGRTSTSSGSVYNKTGSQTVDYYGFMRINPVHLISWRAYKNETVTNAMFVTPVIDSEYTANRNLSKYLSMKFWLCVKT